MTNFIIAWVAIFFSGYIFFDAMAVLSRASAAAASINAFGSAIEKIMNTIKRLSIFSFPPALGYFVYIQDINALFISVILSYSIGGFVLLLVLRFRVLFIHYFYRVSVSFHSGSTIVKSFLFPRVLCDADKFNLLEFNHIIPLHAAVRANMALFFLASWVYFVFGASVFVINIIAIRFIELAPMVLQGLGFLNGLGTLVLAFLVDPKVSRFLDKKEKLGDIVVVILASQLTGIWVYSIIFYYIIYSLY